MKNIKFFPIFLLFIIFYADNLFAGNYFDKKVILSGIKKIHLPFIANAGQISDKEVIFYANTLTGKVLITQKGEILYLISRIEKDKLIKTIVLKEEFDTEYFKTIKGEEASITKVNYFKGNLQTKWKNNLKTYNLINLGEIYKGIELKLKAYGNNIEKLFFVNPCADINDIKIRLKGTKEIQINKNGELEAITKFGNIIFTKPKAYQIIKGKRVDVKVEYEIRQKAKGERLKDEEKSEIKENSLLIAHNLSLVYGFKVGNYDKSKELVIDPLLSSTFLGGEADDKAYAIAIDSMGNIYVAGESLSANFPTKSGVYDTSYNSQFDAFVSKFNNDLTTLKFSTYLGGDSDDRAKCITINSKGEILVAGTALSSNFPTTPDAYMPTGNSGTFITKLDSDLTNILASTYFVYQLIYSIPSIKTDSNDDIYFATSGSLVCKINNNLSSLLASKDIGGNGATEITYLDIGQSGNIYVTGWTNAPDFPITPGAYDTYFSGPEFGHIYITKLDSGLASILASTFLNIGYSDSLILDTNENAYVVGYTDQQNFPVTSGAYDTSPNGNDDGFIAKLDSSLSFLLASTFLGDIDKDHIESIDIGVNGDVYVTGWTWSLNFPTTANAYDTSNTSSEEIFISKFDNNLTSLLSSTYFGGIGWEKTNFITLDNNENVYIAGATSSYIQFPISNNTYDTLYNGGFSDAFVAKFDKNLSISLPVISISANKYDFGNITIKSESSPFELTISNTGYQKLIISAISLDTTNFSINLNGGSNPIKSLPGTISPNTICTLTITFKPKEAKTLNEMLTIFSNVPDNNGKTTISLTGTGTLLNIPSIYLSNYYYDFGNTTIGSQSTPLELVITNQSLQILNISNIFLSDTTNFSLNINGGVHPIEILPSDIASNSSNTITIMFNPKEPKIFNEILTIFSNDPDNNGVDKLYLKGEGVVNKVPNLSLSTNNHNFGNILIDTLSAPFELIIFNNGTQDLQISNITLSNIENFSFNLNGGSNPIKELPAVITPGLNKTLTIIFIPRELKTFNEVLSISSNDPDNYGEVELNLTGTGISNLSPEISLSANSYDFGNISIGESSTPFELAISNTGTQDLSISEIILSDTTNFNLNLNGESNPLGILPAVIIPDSKKNISILFIPKVKKSYNVSLAIFSNAEDVKIYLTGKGINNNTTDISNKKTKNKKNPCFISEIMNISYGKIVWHTLSLIVIFYFLYCTYSRCLSFIYKKKL